MDQSERTFERLRAIFDENGDALRKQFILAGLLLTIFERFKDYVISQVDGFFSNHWEIADGNIKYARGEQFKKLIKELGKGQPGEHSNEVFRAAIRWLGSLDAVEEWELKEVERLYSLRNDIGHELFHILADDSKKPITVVDVMLTFGVYVKVVRWWVREVELTTDPDMTEEKWNSINFDGIESFDTMMLREMLQKSLEGFPEWIEIQEWAKATHKTSRDVPADEEPETPRPFYPRRTKKGSPNLTE